MVSSKEVKADLREHDHVVECVNWAPNSAYSNIATAAGLQVSRSLSDIASITAQRGGQRKRGIRIEGEGGRQVKKDICGGIYVEG